jgi:hypothetical protein
MILIIDSGHQVLVLLSLVIAPTIFLSFYQIFIREADAEKALCV